MTALRLDRPLPLGLVVYGGAALVVAGTAASILLTDLAPLQISAMLLALAGAAYLGVWTSPATFVVAGLAGAVFSGHSDELGLPIGPDRLLLGAGLAALALGLPGVRRYRTIVWRPVHALLGIVAALAIASALRAGTLLTEDGIFSLLDRLGIVPFALFTLAPILFGGRRQRNALLVGIVGLGTYLSLTTLFEAIGATGLVWPRYITDPGVGIHFGRARGPFAEAAGNGLALYGCAVAAAVAVVTWTSRRARWYAGTVSLLCVLGTIFTLTRAVWVGTALATILALLANHRTRAILGPLLAVAAIALVLALAFVPGFSEQAERRSESQRPLWDRYNTNRAAVEMIRDEPLVGIGWEQFKVESRDYMVLSDDYPLTGIDLDVHNVPLAYAAELGLPTALLWLLALFSALGAAVLRPGPAELDPWRLGAIALFVSWAVAAMFGPVSQAFVTALLWLWLGIAALGHTSVPVDPADAPLD